MKLKKDEVIVVRRSKEKNISHGGFEYQMKKGAIVEAEDWTDDAVYGDGLHGWTKGFTWYIDNELNEYFQVLLVNKKDGYVELGNKVKFRKGKILYNGKDRDKAYKIIEDVYGELPLHWKNMKDEHESTQTAGHKSTQKAGDWSTQTAGHWSTQKAGDRSTQTAIDEAIQKAGHRSIQRAGNIATQTARDDATQKAGHESTQKAERWSTQKAEDNATQTAGYESTQTAGHWSTQTARHWSTQTAKDNATQKAGHESTQTAGDESTQTAGDESTQTARDEAIQKAEDWSTQTAGDKSAQIVGNWSTQTAWCKSTQKAGDFSTSTVLSHQDDYEISQIVKTGKFSTVVYKNIPNKISTTFETGDNETTTFVIDSTGKLVAKYHYTPENIESLREHEIIVFGTNKEGNHAGGLAKTCKETFGAIEGQAEGMQGQCFGIITMEGIEEIKNGLRKLRDEAIEQKQKIFLLTKIGTGIAGYSIKEIARLVNEIDFPANVVLPKEFEL